MLFNIINDRNIVRVSRKKIYWWVLIFITAKFFLLFLFSLYFSITQNYSSHWNTCFVIFPLLFLHPFLETTAPWCVPFFWDSSVVLLQCPQSPYMHPLFGPETLPLRNQAGWSSHFRCSSWVLEEGRTWDWGPCSLQVPYVFYAYICLSDVKTLLIFSMFFQLLKLKMPNLLLCYYSY